MSSLRHEKAEIILKLALGMQATRAGISLKDIQQEFDVSRRTAERLRDAVERVFPQMEEVETGERTKYWRLPPGALSRLMDCSADQLAALQTATNLLRKEGLDGQVKELEQLRISLKGALHPERLRRLEPDLEALTLAEGLAMRPGPRRILNAHFVSALRNAILGMQEVRVRYTSRGSGRKSWQILHPYGFLYGRKAYLVAYSPKAEDWRLWLLAHISEVEQTGKLYDRDPDFSLQSYAEQSFGVFQEDPADICLRFSAEAAEDARTFNFHPSQTLEDEQDGSLIVRFKAGGLTELCWHLFTWGSAVEVLEPEILRERLRDMCTEVAATL